MSADTEKTSERTVGPELRLLDRRAFVGFPELKVAPGVVVTDFALQIPEVTFPLNVSGGAARYQKKKLDFGYLEVSIDAEAIARRVSQLSGKLAELDGLKLHFRPGYLEAQAVLSRDRAALTFKVAFDGDGESLAVYLYDVRFYGFSTTPASRLPAAIAEAVKELGVLPGVERRGANGFSTRILAPLVELCAVGRGYKQPSLDSARLAEASVSSRGLRLRFASGGLPPPAAPDEELLLTLEGARAFADAEELLANGKLAQAREAYLKLGDANEAHPFAVERLLTLLVADPQTHELALDVAASLARRRDKSATALWAEAVVRERRGEFARAGERFLALSALARKHQEDASAFFAAEAAARSARDNAPQMAVKALHELLGLKPDHLPSLKALARAADQAKDRAGAIRAYRRLAALARDPAEAADAHVQLARLSAQTEDDIAGARLHCEAALRLAPDQPDALMLLGELCFRGGEHLRAIKALDRLREVAMGRHEVDRVGRANLLAGKVWETGLKQPENALLRYREAVSLLPGDAEALYFAARVADGLGRLQEAVAGYQQAVQLAGPAPRTEEARKAAHASNHALAALYQTRLGEPGRAREHLEAALALDPSDLPALDALLPYYRATGKAPELAEACEKAAAVLEEPARRAALWAEAGELYRGRLSQPDKAERLLGQALEADPKNRVALEGMLALAEARRDGGQLCRALKALVELSAEPKERARYARRLAVAARDLAFDLELASSAFRKVLEVEPDELPVLGELTALERRRQDMPALAWALEQRARVAESLGDKRLAAAALRELSQVLEARLGRAGEALVALEKAARLFPDPNVLLELANLSLRCERPANARRALEDMLGLLPKHAAPEKLAEVKAKLGRACELLGDKEKAREAYAAAFPLRRLDDELSSRLAALYEEAGLQRELTDLWASRAQALLQAGRAADAAPLFFKSAQALLAQGDAGGALQRLQAALEAAPSGDAAAQVLEAMADLELGRGEKLEAARLFARRGALLEGRPAARLFLRAAQLGEGSAREAGFLEDALRADPTLAPARVRRAALRFEADPRSALSDLEAVLESDSNDVDTLAAQLDRVALTRRAGQAAIQAGLSDSARRLLAVYAAHRPDDLEVMMELAHLHRKAGATEALVDLLGELWPRLEGASRRAARREFAEGALKLERRPEAAEALRSLLRDEPADAWAVARLFELLPSTTETARERLTLLGQLVETMEGQQKAELLARRAALHKDFGDIPAARSDLVDAVHLSAEPVPLLQQLALLAQDEGDDLAELSVWVLALQRAPNAKALTDEARARLLLLAKGRLERDDPHRAREAYAAVATLQLSPDNRFEAYRGLATAARAVQDFPAMEAALLEAGKQGPVPGRVEALLERAAALEVRGARADAISAFEAALELSPENALATQGLKRTLLAEQDFEGLAEVLASEAARTPRAQAAPLYRQLAALYLDTLKEPGPAEAALRQVVLLEKGDVAARRTLAGLLQTRGALPEAMALLEEAAKGLPNAEAATLLREAAALAQGDGAAQLRLARAAHALTPARGEELESLTRSLYLQGALGEALPLAKALVESSSFEAAPEAAERANLLLADLAEAMNLPETAEQSLRRIVAQRPWREAAVERLAELLKVKSPRESIGLLATYAEGLAPSARTEGLLLSLARRSRAELADLELSSRLYRKAAEGSSEPLALREELAQVLREAGRASELMAELQAIAQVKLTSGDTAGALAAWDEEATLAQGAGRIDEALRTRQAMADVAGDEGMPERAAQELVLKSELLSEARLDLQAALETLERAWDWAPRADIAKAGVELARRRADREAEIDWLERTFGALTSAPERTRAFVQLARLHLGLVAEGQSVADAQLDAADQAEAALQQALALSPRDAEGEATLLALYERQGRQAEVAGYFEEAAVRAPSLAERAQLLLHAAQLYKEKAGLPHEAAAALLAARAASPDDVALTTRVADLLHELSRSNEAADFDALLLEADPFHPAFARHRAWLEETGDAQGLAALLSRRAERLRGEEASALWLLAAQAFERAGARERARLCENQAFEAAPENSEAFEVLVARAQGDARRLAALQAARARAVPAEAPTLLKARAEGLTAAREALLAAPAWDDYLALVPDDAAALAIRADLAADSGGARAAQPFDRVLAQRFLEQLQPARQVKTWLRLGHAALEAQAFVDAAEAFEAAYALDEAGESGREALALLAEAHTRTQDTFGLYRATLRLAQRASGPEQEGLYRRAAALFEEPKDALEAVSWLFDAHPADVDAYSAVRRALLGAGRTGELLAAHERFARASGGPRGAEALLDAAELAERELSDTEKAAELRAEASKLDPSNLEALRSVIAQQRRAGDTQGLLESLPRLATSARDALGAAEAWLELAALREDAQDFEGARTALTQVQQGGPRAEGYAAALEGLERLAARAADAQALGALQAERAELFSGEARADKLLQAAGSFFTAGQLERAEGLARAALLLRSSKEGLLLQAKLSGALAAWPQQAGALLEAAQLSIAEERAALLLEASAAWEAAGDAIEAQQVLSRVAREHPGFVAPTALGERFTRLGAPALALEAAFAPALQEGRFAFALALADGANDDARRTEALWATVTAQADLTSLARLAALLVARQDTAGQLALADRAQRSGFPEQARALWLRLFLDEANASALGALEAAGALEKAAQLALARVAQRAGEGQSQAATEASSTAQPREASTEESSAATAKSRAGSMESAATAKAGEASTEESSPATAQSQAAANALSVRNPSAAANDDLAPESARGFRPAPGPRAAAETALARALLELLLPRAEELSRSTREALWVAAAQVLPARRKGLFAALAQLQRDDGRFAQAAESLGQVAFEEGDVRARAALHVERGELLLQGAKDPAAARLAYERALVDDANQVGAVRALVSLTDPADVERFVGFAERLSALAGVEALEPYRARLADGYEQFGRLREAAALLAQLPVTPQLLARRVRVAEGLGLTGEALQLREQAATTDAEREAVLVGYLNAQLVPFAVRLGEQLVREGTLSAATTRLLAERLAPTAQGAALSARLWPAQLRANVRDIDGWTLFAEALRKLGREGDAALVDGFGGLLSGSTTPAAQPRVTPVETPEVRKFPPLPEGLVEVTERSMPLLQAATHDMLEALGARGMGVLLDLGGGPEAWQAAHDVVVLGAGSLAFGPGELGYLIALALALGEQGRVLTTPEEAPGMVEAAVAAFEAWPSSLAAGRVLALLDVRVRGTDPAFISPQEVLADNAAFRAVALKALETLG